MTKWNYLNLKYDIKQQITLLFKEDNIGFICLHALNCLEIACIEISSSYDVISEKHEFLKCYYINSLNLAKMIKIIRMKFWIFKNKRNVQYV